MKKLLSIILSLTLVFAMSATAFAAGPADKFNSSNPELQAVLEKIDPQYIEDYNALTFEQKDIKLRELSQTYTTPGTVLSEADSAFILLNRYEKEKCHNRWPVLPLNGTMSIKPNIKLK